MINLTVAKPMKVSGRYSVFVTFSFRQDIVNYLKSFRVSYYHPELKAWEIPLLELADMIDYFSHIDDVELKVLEYDDEKEEHELTQDYKLKLSKYQEEGIKYGLGSDKWLLLDEMGLGKTAQMIGLARELKAQRGISHCLVICCVNTLKTNWKREIEKHSDETCVILGERVTSTGSVVYDSIEKRAEQLKNPIDEFFIITNIESFRDERMIKAFKKSKNKIDMIVVDECHKCKDSESQQGKGLLKLDAKYKIGLTGTPMLNKPTDLFVPLKWTDNDSATLGTFEAQYCVYGGVSGHEVVGYKNLDLLKDELDCCSLRRTKDLLDLPEKTVINEIVDMNDDQARFYSDVCNGLKKEVDKVRLHPNNLLSMITRLRQATVCPTILTTNNIKSSKVERCIDLIEQIIAQGDKVVVMSTFKEPLSIIADRLKDYKPLLCTGDVKDYEIERNITKFQGNPNSKIMLCTWQRMGTGVTLTAASYMIHLDTAYTSALFEQTCDRIHRIGQKNPVFIYNLICKDTVDETVAELVARKKALSDFVVDDKLDDESFQVLSRYVLGL